MGHCRYRAPIRIEGRYGYADAHDMYALLGTAVLPAEGMPERLIQGVRVYVKPLPAGRPAWAGRVNRQSLRVTAICLCGRHVPVGRLHQHACATPINSASGECR